MGCAPSRFPQMGSPTPHLDRVPTPTNDTAQVTLDLTSNATIGGFGVGKGNKNKRQVSQLFSNLKDIVKHGDGFCYMRNMLYSRCPHARRRDTV